MAIPDDTLKATAEDIIRQAVKGITFNAIHAHMTTRYGFAGFSDGDLDYVDALISSYSSVEVRFDV